MRKKSQIDTDLLVVTVVYFFFVDKEEKCTEKKKLYSTVNGKVSQSPKKKFF